MPRPGRERNIGSEKERASIFKVQYVVQSTLLWVFAREIFLYINDSFFLLDSDSKSGKHVLLPRFVTCSKDIRKMYKSSENLLQIKKQHTSNIPCEINITNIRNTSRNSLTQTLMRSVIYRSRFLLLCKRCFSNPGERWRVFRKRHCWSKSTMILLLSNWSILIKSKLDQMQLF